jgi:serine/threonine protein kinase
MTDKILNNKLTIIEIIGKGVYGTTYKVNLNDKLYALKKQKILDEDKKKDINKNIWRELEFYKWVNKLDKNNQIFFNKLYDFNIIDSCKFNQERIFIDNSIKKLDKSHTCIEMLFDLKDGNIINLNLNNKQKMSLLIQIIYAIYLMRKNKWIHRDIHPGNICYKRIDNNSYITIKLDKTYKIPSYGYIFSLIDMGFIYNYKFIKTKKEKDGFNKNYDFNFDLWCLIEDYCLNGFSNAVSIKKNNINTQTFPKKLIKFIYMNDKLLYNKIKFIMININDIYSKEFNNLENNKKIDNLFMYEFNQFVKIYKPEVFYQELGIKYEDNLFDINILEFIKLNCNNMKFIISELIKLI